MAEGNVMEEIMELAGGFIASIPERVEGYFGIIDVVRGAFIELLTKMGFDPFNFLFWAFIVLLGIFVVMRRLKIIQYGIVLFLGIAVVMLLL